MHVAVLAPLLSSTFSILLLQRVCCTNHPSSLSPYSSSAYLEEDLSKRKIAEQHPSRQDQAMDSQTRLDLAVHSNSKIHVPDSLH